jgi:hypothetical protein
VHNTQPWVLVLHPDRIAVRADRSRQLGVLAARGYAVEVDRLPQPGDPDLVAVLRLVAGTPDPDLARLAPQVATRRTNRRGYADDPVPAAVLDRVHAAAAAEDTVVVPVLTEDQHRLVARLAQAADAEQNADAARRHELRTWTNRGSARGDGVPPTTVPRVDGGAHDDVPVRDFDTWGPGALPAVPPAAAPHHPTPVPDGRGGTMWI